MPKEKSIARMHYLIYYLDNIFNYYKRYIFNILGLILILKVICDSLNDKEG